MARDLAPQSTVSQRPQVAYADYSSDQALDATQIPVARGIDVEAQLAQYSRRRTDRRAGPGPLGHMAQYGNQPVVFGQPAQAQTQQVGRDGGNGRLPVTTAPALVQASAVVLPEMTLPLAGASAGPTAQRGAGRVDVVMLAAVSIAAKAQQRL